MSLGLAVSGICKGYNGKVVLEDCYVSFSGGGIYLLMGPNGSGKSTFLRICALLENPDKGEVLYFSGGAPLKKDLELKRWITIVLPGIGIFNTTVFRNVAYGLRIRGVDRKETEERVNRVLESTGLIHKKNHNAHTLSSGERQRLGIARALVVEPGVLFLDEPTASVDEENTEIIEDIILNISSRKGHGGQERRTTVIITTHDAVQAERLNGRTFTMQHGGIVERKR